MMLRVKDDEDDIDFGKSLLEANKPPPKATNLIFSDWDRDRQKVKPNL
jgi:hypothetical protein